LFFCLEINYCHQVQVITKCFTHTKNILHSNRETTAVDIRGHRGVWSVGARHSPLRPTAAARKRKQTHRKTPICVNKILTNSAINFVQLLKQCNLVLFITNNDGSKIEKLQLTTFVCSTTSTTTARRTSKQTKTLSTDRRAAGCSPRRVQTGGHLHR